MCLKFCGKKGSILYEQCKPNGFKRPSKAFTKRPNEVVLLLQSILEFQATLNLETTRCLEYSSYFFANSKRLRAVTIEMPETSI